jgi:hypothetical protein
MNNVLDIAVLPAMDTVGGHFVVLTAMFLGGDGTWSRLTLVDVTLSII